MIKKLLLDLSNTTQVNAALVTAAAEASAAAEAEAERREIASAASSSAGVGSSSGGSGLLPLRRGSLSGALAAPASTSVMISLPTGPFYGGAAVPGPAEDATGHWVLRWAQGFCAHVGTPALWCYSSNSFFKLFF